MFPLAKPHILLRGEFRENKFYLQLQTRILFERPKYYSLSFVTFQIYFSKDNQAEHLLVYSNFWAIQFSDFKMKAKLFC